MSKTLNKICVTYQDTLYDILYFKVRISVCCADVAVCVNVFVSELQAQSVHLRC